MTGISSRILPVHALTRAPRWKHIHATDAASQKSVLLSSDGVSVDGAAELVSRVLVTGTS